MANRRRSYFNKAQLKCAFVAFFSCFPNQSVWVFDRGETEEDHQKSIEFLWQKFVGFLSEVREDG